MKRFNTTAVCVPSKHYMVDLTERVRAVRQMVDDGKYFVINRARQYGKTTLLRAVRRALSEDYTVLDLSFERISQGGYRTEGEFVQTFSRILLDQAEFYGIAFPEKTIAALEELLQRNPNRLMLDELFRILRRWMVRSEKRVVLLIDEIDRATNNEVFLDFLGLLRDGYIAREGDGIPTFQSVILAGVTDVRYLKSKIRPEEQHRVNSPWNVAANFDIDMSFSVADIQGMLDEYEADHQTGMDTEEIAGQIREYTNGYPYLVSRICEVIDKTLVPEKFRDLSNAWTNYGLDEAVKAILSERGNSLFKSLTAKLTNYPNLKNKLRSILMRGETYSWQPYDEEQQQLFMYGLIRNNHNTVAIDNRIFEMLLYSSFIGESDQNNDLKQRGSDTKSIFVDADGWLDIPKIMEHFIKEHNRIHPENSEKFLEEEGRERFLTYISAIINGTGTYSIEEETRNHRRMDVVIHYLGRRYIIELKIWRGERYNAEGEQQIRDYLDSFGLETGYLLSFCFNKNKKSGVERIRIGTKTLFEGVV